MPPSDSGLSRQAVGWALIGQAIWLPVLLIAVHDRWLSGTGRPATTTVSAAAQGRLQAPPLSLSDVVKAAPPPPSSQLASTQPAPSSTLMPPLQTTAAAGMAAAAGTAGGAGMVLRSPAARPSRPTAGAPDRKPVPAGMPAGRSVPAPGTAAAPQAHRTPQRVSPSQLLGGTLALRDLPDALWRGNTPPSSAAAASAGGPSRSASDDRP